METLNECSWDLTTSKRRRRPAALNSKTRMMQVRMAQIIWGLTEAVSLVRHLLKIILITRLMEQSQVQSETPKTKMTGDFPQRRLSNRLTRLVETQEIMALRRRKLTCSHLLLFQARQSLNRRMNHLSFQQSQARLIAQVP